MKKSSGSLWLRLLCLALCLVMVFSLGACGSEKEATDVLAKIRDLGYKNAYFTAG